jgi:hypothetical protein
MLPGWFSCMLACCVLVVLCLGLGVVIDDDVRTYVLHVFCVILSSHIDVIIVRDSDQHQNLHDSRQGCIRYEPFAGVDRQQYAAMGPTSLTWWVPRLGAVGSSSLPTTQIFTMHSISRKPTISRGTPSVDPASISSIRDHFHSNDCRISPMSLRSNSPFTSHTTSKPATISEVHPPSSLSHLSMGSSHATMAHQLHYITV